MNVFFLNELQSQMKYWGGGVNETRIVSLQDDGQCVFKPKEGELLSDRSGYKRERAAYLVDKFLGIGLVPPTVIREVNGKVGSAQRFIPDTEVPWMALPECPEDKRTEVKTELFKLFILDYVTLNADRHANNALISKDYSRVYAIDNGYCFAFEGMRFTFEFLDLIQGQTIPEEIKTMVRQILENEPLKSVLKDLLLELLPEDQAEACMQRIEYLRMLVLDTTVLDMSTVYQLTYFQKE